MIKKIDIKNLTVFSDITFDFSPNLNIIIGENGSGKSHLLKAMYTLIATSAAEGKKQNSSSPTKNALQSSIADKLIGVMRPETVGRLARRKQGRERCEIKISFDASALDIAISFATNSKSEVSVERLPAIWIEKAPVYLPTRELLTIYPNFISVYEGHYLEFEETWRDTCILLGALLQRGPTEQRIKALLAPIEKAMGGSVILDKNGRFYLSTLKHGTMEMPLVAEGVRKLAMVARLIATGSLVDNGVLFWDEPEANLNPRLIRLIAEVIHALAAEGIQIFIATHSFFLLKELELLNKSANPINQNFISLKWNEERQFVVKEQAGSLSGLTDIVALDEELAQYDREMRLQ